MRGHAELLRVLCAHDVEFIIVGGLAAVLQGAPVTTLDVDIVYARTPDNIERLGRALSELSAEFRDDPRHLRPNESHLQSKGHKLLVTAHGALDVLGTIEEDTGYEDLLSGSVIMSVAGSNVRVLSLERLIAVKRSLSRPKDKLMLAILEAALDEKNRREGR